MLEQENRNILIVSPGDASGKLAGSFAEVYGPEIHFADFEYTTSLHKAVQSFQEETFVLCAVSTQFPEDDIRMFFQDLQSIDGGKGVSFVALVDPMPEDLNREEPKSLGFDGVVTLAGSHEDREQITEALKRKEEEIILIQRKLDVNTALNVVLRKLDVAARDLKRGITPKLDRMPADFLELQTEYDDAILDEYFQKLESKTQECEPENASELSVPEEVLKKDLPNLVNNKYTGVSARVWKRLLRKHGRKDPTS